MAELEPSEHPRTAPASGQRSSFNNAIADNPIAAVPEVELPESSAAAAEDAPRGRRAAAMFIFLTVTLDMLAMGMIAPVLPRLIAGFLHGDASSAAKMLGLFGTG